MTMDFAEIVRDEGDETVTFVVSDHADDDDAREYLSDYGDSSSVAALLTGANGFDFDSPIWMHCDTAMELHEAGIIDMTSQQSVNFLGHTVYLYETQ